MTEEARKLADRLEGRLDPFNFITAEECSLAVAALRRSEPGTLAREEVARLVAKECFGLILYGMQGLSRKACFRTADAILALTPSYEESKAQVLNAIRDALEIRGYFHMANGRDIGILLDAIPAGTQRNVAHEDCLNCHCSDESLCAGTEPRSRKMVPEIPFDPTNHHNALKCPYCNPQGLKFAKAGTQKPVAWRRTLSAIKKIALNVKPDGLRDGLASIVRLCIDAGSPPSSKRNWTEDASHENGNYECLCVECDQPFTGHKRRVICKACSELLSRAAPASQDATREALKHAKIDLEAAKVLAQHTLGEPHGINQTLALIDAALASPAVRADRETK